MNAAKDVIQSAIEKEQTIYLLEGHIEPRIIPLHVVKFTVGDTHKFILEGTKEDLSISLPADDATISRYVRFNKLFLSEKDARNHFDLIIESTISDINDQSKEELINRFFKDWVSEGVNEKVKDAMVKKISKEFGVTVNAN